MNVSCSTHGEMRNVYKILVGKHEAKRSLGKPRSRWQDGCEGNRLESFGLRSSEDGLSIDP
jgi:hypothetical protein